MSRITHSPLSLEDTATVFGHQDADPQYFFFHIIIQNTENPCLSLASMVSIMVISPLSPRCMFILNFLLTE